MEGRPSVKMRGPYGVLLAAAAITVLTACVSGGTPMTSPTSSTSSTPGTTTDVPPKRWAAIVGDLATRGVPTDAVGLVSARTVTWNDGSLGCPKPGQSYTQSLVPGMQVVVKVGTVEYDYRFGRTDTPKLCQK